MSDDPSIKSLQDLKKTLVAFFDELIEMFRDEGQFVAFRIMIKDQIPITTIYKLFRDKMWNERERIKGRDVSFFKDNVLFSQLGPEHSENFCRLFHSLDDENKKVIWKWFDAFIILTNRCMSS